MRTQALIVTSLLGCGTFGQVIEVQNVATQEKYAIKVIKNRRAYLEQAKLEMLILNVLNKIYDPKDQFGIVQLLAQFSHKNHLWFVFPLVCIVIKYIHSF